MQRKKETKKIRRTTSGSVKYVKTGVMVTTGKVQDVLGLTVDFYITKREKTVEFVLRGNAENAKRQHTSVNLSMKMKRSYRRMF